MKRLLLIILCFILPILIVSCGGKKGDKDIELMGAGDRIHDSFTFANIGVELTETEDNVYKISGSVEKLNDDAVKQEFGIGEAVNHVVAIKLSANGKEIDKEKVSIKIDGVESFDAEHLNGSDYTFIILEAAKGKSVSVEVSWNGEDKNTYVIVFDENLSLK